jgi:soluble lytic murein transglycosylase-like protein
LTSAGRDDTLVQMRRIVIGLAASVFPVLGLAQIYAGTSQESGAIVLSSFASSEAGVLLLPAPQAVRPVFEPLAATGSIARAPRPIPPELHRIIESAASRSTVSPLLIRAVIDAESNFDAKAVSSRGAIGLMQLLPATAKRFGANDPFDPQQNVAAGTAYLKWLMTFFEDDLELVLAGYNAGEQAVVRAGRRVPQYAETQAYVKRVMASLRRTGAIPL